MEIFFYLKLFISFLVMNPIECQNYDPFDGKEMVQGSFQPPISSSRFQYQTSSQNPTSSVQQNGSAEPSEVSSLDEREQSLENIENKELIVTTDRVNSSMSSLLQTTKATVSSGIYFWIAIAVIYVILVVIALICTLKTFCEIKQTENIEEQRVTEVAAILESQVSETVVQQYNEEVSQPGIAPVPSDENKGSSVRSKRSNLTSGQTTTSPNEKQGEKIKSETTLSSTQTNSPRSHQTIAINKLKSNPSAGATSATGSQ